MRATSAPSWTRPTIIPLDRCTATSDWGVGDTRRRRLPVPDRPAGEHRRPLLPRRRQSARLPRRRRGAARDPGQAGEFADSLGGRFIWTQSTELRFPLPISPDLGLTGRTFADIGALAVVKRIPGAPITDYPRPARGRRRRRVLEVAVRPDQCRSRDTRREVATSTRPSCSASASARGSSAHASIPPHRRRSPRRCCRPWRRRRRRRTRTTSSPARPAAGRGAGQGPRRAQRHGSAAGRRRGRSFAMPPGAGRAPRRGAAAAAELRPAAGAGTAAAAQGRGAARRGDRRARRARGDARLHRRPAGREGDRRAAQQAQRGRAEGTGASGATCSRRWSTTAAKLSPEQIRTRERELQERITNAQRDLPRAQPDHPGGGAVRAGSRSSARWSA